MSDCEEFKKEIRGGIAKLENRLNTATKEIADMRLSRTRREEQCNSKHVLLNDRSKLLKELLEAVKSEFGKTRNDIVSAISKDTELLLERHKLDLEKSVNVKISAVRDEIKTKSDAIREKTVSKNSLWVWVGIIIFCFGAGVTFATIAINSPSEDKSHKQAEDMAQIIIEKIEKGKK